MTLAVHRAAHTGQATQIEQARAQAEVLAAMEAAKRWPRDEDLAEEKMRRACARPQVAEKAFWAFPRAGEQLTGATIHLATTLAGIWGNVQYGVVELERNAARGESQMLAVAWELETNTRATTTFLVPHARDSKRGRTDLTDLRDVYENNANQGARRVREMVFKILPDWYVETAEDICRATLERSDKPIEQQRAGIAKAFEELGVATEQLVAKIGRDWDQTTPGDLAILRIVGKSIRRGETTVREQFPTVTPAPAASSGGVTAADILPPPAPPPPADESADQPTPDPKKRNARMFALLRDAGLDGDKNRDRRLRFLGLVNERDISSSNDLDAQEREVVIHYLEGLSADGKITDAYDIAQQEATGGQS